MTKHQNNFSLDYQENTKKIEERISQLETGSIINYCGFVVGLL